MNFKRWKYKNTVFLILSFVIFFYLSGTAFAENFIYQIGNLGYFGAFIVGIFFVCVFTFAPASVVLFYMARDLNPLLVAAIAGLGAMLGDYVIFRFLKDRLFEELTPLFNKVGGSYLIGLLHTPYFVWVLPFLGALIVASPFPDEIGLGLMGLSKIKTWQFVLLTFILNSLGILVIVSLSRFH